MKEISKNRFDYDIENIYPDSDMTNKLFCTFATEETLEETLEKIQRKYKILYNKIFVLYSEQQQEYLCTYNVDLGNVSNFIVNTILVHRKKDTNTLYTINALNTLIETLNGGVLDTNFIIDWDKYKNRVLLTKGSELREVPTKLFRIINL